jgi:hypothetical protein
MMGSIILALSHQDDFLSPHLSSSRPLCSKTYFGSSVCFGSSERCLCGNGKYDEHRTCDRRQH